MIENTLEHARQDNKWTNSAFHALYEGSMLITMLFIERQIEFLIQMYSRCRSRTRVRILLGLTRFFDLRAKGVDRLIQTFLLLIGCDELVTEAMHGFLEVRYLLF